MKHTFADLIRAASHNEAARVASVIRDRRGNGVVEFAFVTMVLALLGVGMFDVGRYALAHTRAYSAARAGVQYGTLNQGTSGDLAGMEAAAYEDAGVDADNPGHFAPAADTYCMCPGQTTPEADCTGQCAGGAYKPRYVEVEVNDAVDLLFDYPGLPETLGVNTAARMRIR